MWPSRIPSTAHTPTPPIPTSPAIPDPPAESGSWDQDDDGWEQEKFTPLPSHSPSHTPSRTPSPFALDDHFNENIQFFDPGDKFYRHYHPKLTAQPCNEHGEFLENGAPPPAQVDDSQSWFPYENQLQFKTAEFLYSKCQMSASKIDTLLDLWASSLYPHGAWPPFVNHHHLYDIIDSTKFGSDIKWQCLLATYTGDVPTVDLPQWMSQKFDIWYHDPCLVTHLILGNTSLAGEINLHPFQEYSTDNQERHYKDFMSGEWAWEQADVIVEDQCTHGSAFILIILGSDKTTMSVATGNNEYYPLYMSIGNV
ncbi:hypothetical protein J3R82DRAFT_108 [Butyriboletus roseoflavus]|nr:hypothetical protein J3R82DRAFT_108 [Butyriboletus roseoflavus]